MRLLDYIASYKLLAFLLVASLVASAASIFIDIRSATSTVWFQSSGGVWTVSSIVGFMFKVVHRRKDNQSILPTWQELHTEIATAVNFYAYPAMAVIGAVISAYGWLVK